MQNSFSKKFRDFYQKLPPYVQKQADKMDNKLSKRHDKSGLYNTGNELPNIIAQHA